MKYGRRSIANRLEKANTKIAICVHRPSDTDNKLSKRNNKKSTGRMDANDKNATCRRARMVQTYLIDLRSAKSQGCDNTSNTSKKETNAAGNARRGNVKKQNGRTRNPANRRSKRG